MSPKLTPKWTLIFLLSAKNNLFMEQLNVIKEIYSVGSSDDVNFVIILDGLGGDKFSELMEKPTIFHAKKNSDFLTDAHIHILERKNATLTNKKDLKELLDFVIRNFEADNFGFFYKGHGGPGETDIPKGVFDTKLEFIDPGLTDEQINDKFKNSQRGWTFEGYSEYPSEEKNTKNKKPVLLIYSKKNTKALSYSALASVLKDAFKGKLGFLCMDCCWAQQIENAYNFIDVADYFIASADEMPALGLGYTQLCSHFIKRPAIQPVEAANLLVAINFNQNYADYDGDVPEFREMGISITSISTKEFKKFLEAFSELCKLLTERLKEKDDYTYKIFEGARGNCLDYTYQDTDNLTADKIDYPMFNIDLIWLLENLLFYNVNEEIDTKIYNAIYRVQNELITSYMGNNYKKALMGTRCIGGKGISICFPKNNLFAERSILFSKAMSFYDEAGWRDLLKTYYKYEPKGKALDPFELDIAKKLFPDKPGKNTKRNETTERSRFNSMRKKEIFKAKAEDKQVSPAN